MSVSREWRRLVGCLLAIAVLWGGVLPWIGSFESVQSSIRFMEDRGIDPSAMYYTDLPAMSRLQAKIDRARHEHPEAFWPMKNSTVSEAP